VKNGFLHRTIFGAIRQNNHFVESRQDSQAFEKLGECWLNILTQRRKGAEKNLEMISVQKLCGFAF
jgi:hypothetical protein